MVPTPSRLSVETDERVQVVDVTAAVADAVSGRIKQGCCHVFVPHTTAGVVVNEHESGLVADLEGLLARLVPRDDGYDHDAIDDNAHAHLRAMLLGESVTIPMIDGELGLGTWQSVLFVEGDGPRNRELVVTTLGATD